MNRTFAELGVPEVLIDALAANGIDAPFSIQTLTLADSLAGHDLCGRAPTGSGKTLAFAIPFAARARRARPGHPSALILVPTRELAAQVAETLRPLAKARKRRVATFYGGTNLRRDQQMLRSGVDIAVATPGRLADLVKRRDCNLGEVDLVALDEADRMADMGFLPEVKRLLDATADDRQTLLFSATLDGDVRELINRYQTNPVRHEVVPTEEPVDIRHVFWPAERAERRALTAKIVKNVDSAIVFTRTKHGADRLAKQLAKDGIATAAIHGNRSQPQRERALAQFTSGKVTTLVATDVAARGIHVDAVGAVVHFDMPATDKDYVHRSGRTGRAGASGLVLSLVGEAERRATETLQRTLDLPAGLHSIDLALLTADPLPSPISTVARSASPKGGGTRSNGSNGAGARTRSRPPARRKRANADRKRTSNHRGQAAESRQGASTARGERGVSRGEGSVSRREGATPTRAGGAAPSRGRAAPSRGRPGGPARAASGGPKGGARSSQRRRTRR